MMFNAIVFDFDGVLVESADIKTRAFASTFGERPGHVAAITRLHLENVGLTRYQKFEMIHRDILCEPLSEAEMVRLGERFSRAVYAEVVRCPAVAGAEQFLRTYSGRIACFIASATPHEELQAIVTARSLSPYFAAVCGAPPDKAELIERLIQKHQLRRDSVLFVGDALADLEAARNTGIGFVGRVPADGVNPFDGQPVLGVVNDLTALETFLRDDEIR